MNWDKYYLSICEAVALNSKCLSRKIGAIIVLDKSIVSTGYNGPPRGVPDCSKRYFLDRNLRDKGLNTINFETTCPRQAMGFKSGEGLEYCIAGHAERNALINAARHGIAVKDATMYMTCPIPCKDCLVEIINAGISEVVVTKLSLYDISSQYLCEYGNIKIREYDLGESK